MSGGAWERVMGNYNDIIGKSGFETMPEAKYYNKYTSNNLLIACNGGECLSHALSETLGWYEDYQDIFTETQSWIARDGVGSDDSKAGIFALGTGGTAGFSNGGGFRLVMSPNS